MKTCPNCGSILADNEPYCENCGFDPSYDMGSWNNGGYKSYNRPYIHGEHIKSSKNNQDNEGDLIVGILILGVFAFCAYLYLEMYNWNILNLVMSNLLSIIEIIIVVAVFCKVVDYFSNL